MNVLSLFNGMNCGGISLDELGIKYDNYYSSEIEKSCIKMEKVVFPNNIQLGDVRNIDVSTLPKIGLLLAGSPCQSFSMAGKRNGMSTKCEIEVTTLEQYLKLKSEKFEFEGQSYLFWEFVRIKTELENRGDKPYFLLENVMMDSKWETTLNKAVGVFPEEINSALVSAQNRKRLYWSNISGDELTLFGNCISQPKDRKIFLKDIIHENVDVKVPNNTELSKTYTDRYIKSKSDKNARFPKNGAVKCVGTTVNPEAKGTNSRHWVISVDGKSGYVSATDYKQPKQIEINLNTYKVDFNKTLQILDKEVEKGKVGYFKTDSQANRVYFIHDKAVTLCGSAGGGAAKMGQYLFGVISPDRLNKNQNGQRFSDGKKFYTLTTQDKHGVLIEGYIRKLTPIECGRLQTVPDEIIHKMIDSGMSNTALYKAFGNGWTIEVIKHILKGLR